VTYTTIVAGVGDVEANTHVIDRACEMARLCDAALLLVAGFDPVSARDKARINEFAPVADVRVGLTEDQAYAVVEKARDTAVERGVALAQGVVGRGAGGGGGGPPPPAAPPRGAAPTSLIRSARSP